MVDWINKIVAQGIRRPGYPADRWVEQFIYDKFSEIGLVDIRFEPLQCAYWEDRGAELAVTLDGADGSDGGDGGDGGDGSFDCFPVPMSEPGLVRGEVALWDPDHPEAVEGKIALYEVRLLVLPEVFPVLARRSDSGSASAGGLAEAGWAFDPEGTFDAGMHRLPFSVHIQDTMKSAIDSGAIGYIGILRGYPGGGCEYYVPYDGIARPIPGVYIGEAAGDEMLVKLRGAHGATATVEVDAVRGVTTTRNVVGELPGADDEWVVIGTHHDAPWASAVEDGTGIALLLAQASAWASTPPSERPHRLVFLANAGHMSAGAGTRAFIETHRHMLDRTVLEVHLEHAARDTHPSGGAEVAVDRVVPRWWFTTQIPALENAVWDSIRSEHLDRSLILAPDAIGPHPTTDGGFFHLEGVPLVNYLTAPWYLFDSADTLDKVDEPSLGAVTRAAFSVIKSTEGVTASEMRGA